MRIFVTGASGWIGSATVPQLLGAGHEVIGLARSDASAAALTSAGAQVLRGELTDLHSLRKGADGADGVIHLAFIHDFSQYQESARVDREAVEAMGAVLEGSGRPLVIASGVAATKVQGVALTERDGRDPSHPLSERGRTEELALSLAERGVRSASVRLAPTCHGEGDHGFMATLVATAREKGAAAYVGDGTDRWPAVHRLDAGVLFCKAVEDAPPGTVLHGVAEEGVALRDVAAVIGRHLAVPVVSIAPDEAIAHFGWIGMIASADLPTSSALTRERFDWVPAQPGLLADLELGHLLRRELTPRRHVWPDQPAEVQRRPGLGTSELSRRRDHGGDERQRNPTGSDPKRISRGRVRWQRAPRHSRAVRSEAPARSRRVTAGGTIVTSSARVGRPRAHPDRHPTGATGAGRP